MYLLTYFDPESAYPRTIGLFKDEQKAQDYIAVDMKKFNDWNKNLKDLKYNFRVERFYEIEEVDILD